MSRSIVKHRPILDVFRKRAVRRIDFIGMPGFTRTQHENGEIRRSGVAQKNLCSRPFGVCRVAMDRKPTAPVLLLNHPPSMTVRVFNKMRMPIHAGTLRAHSTKFNSAKGVAAL